MCTSNDENCSKAPSSSSQENDSDGVSVGTSALSPRSDLHSSAAGLPSNHLLPEPSSISKVCPVFHSIRFYPTFKDTF